MKKEELTLYRSLLGDIKVRGRQGQHRAALSANAEMIAMYWDIGRMIDARQKEEGWGAGVLPRLAVDLKNDLPEEMGFSLRNLKLMVQFYHEYPDHLAIGQRTVARLPALSSGEKGQRLVAQFEAQPVPATKQMIAAEILQQAAARLTLAHNVILIQKLKHLPTRLWYAK